VSLMMAGSSTNAALGSESTGGLGSPALDVTQVVLDQPGGNAGGVTASKNCGITTGSHPPRMRSISPEAIATAMRPSTTSPAAMKRSAEISDRVRCVDLLFGFAVTNTTEASSQSTGTRQISFKFALYERRLVALPGGTQVASLAFYEIDSCLS